MANTWAKLEDGSWGVRVEGTVDPGMTLVVGRKDGSTSTVVVGSVVWTGVNVSLVTVAKQESAPKPAVKLTPEPSKPRYTARRFIPCGYPGCNPNYCDECDGAGRYGAGW